MLEIHNFTQNEIDKKFFQRMADLVLRKTGFKGETEISLAIVGDARMRRLNKMYRGKNRVTDVLSFDNKSVLPYLAKAFPRLKPNEPARSTARYTAGGLLLRMKLFLPSRLQRPVLMVL